MHTLIIEDHFHSVKAYIKDYPEICGYGATKEEAVGRMVLSSVSAFGVAPGDQDDLGKYECNEPVDPSFRGHNNCVIGTDQNGGCFYAKQIYHKTTMQVLENSAINWYKFASSVCLGILLALVGVGFQEWQYWATLAVTFLLWSNSGHRKNNL